MLNANSISRRVENQNNSLSPSILLLSSALLDLKKGSKATALGTNSVSAATLSDNTPEWVDFDLVTGELLENQSRKERYLLQDASRLILCGAKKPDTVLRQYVENGGLKVVDLDDFYYDSEKGSYYLNVTVPYRPHNISVCCRMAAGDIVKVMKDSQRGKTFYGGVMTCGNIWACPVCSAIVSERRASDVREACEIARSMGLKVTMVTLTTSHNNTDQLESLIDNMMGAFSSFTSHRSTKQWRDDFGVIGYVRATEVTYSARNGWHPHFHLLFFSKHSLPNSYIYTTPTGIRRVRSMALVWQKCCIANELSPPSIEHGLKISEEKSELEEEMSDDIVALYLSKSMNDSKVSIEELKEVFDKKEGKNKWDLASEISKWHSKVGKKLHLTPFDFLRIFNTQLNASGRDKKLMAYCSNLFRDFVNSMYRKSQMYWSTGLRAALGMEEDKEDKEILDENEANATVFAALLRREWKVIVLSGRRSELLHNAEISDFKSFARYIFGICYKDDHDFDSFFAKFSHRVDEVNLNDEKREAFESVKKSEDLEHRQLKQDFVSLSVTSGVLNSSDRRDYKESFDLMSQDIRENHNKQRLEI